MVIWGWAFANDAMSGERRNVLRGVELVQVGEMRGNLDGDGTRDVLHASRAAPFVAVVEVEPFALENECTYAILRWMSVI